MSRSCVSLVSFKVAQNAVCYWLLVDILYEIKLPMFPKKDTQCNHRLVHHICYEHESQFHTIFIAQYYNNVQTEAYIYIYMIHLHLSDAFIQSDLQLHSGYTFSLVHVFSGN